MTLRAMSRREASIFACLCDTVVAPDPVLPPVRETGATSFFDLWLARSPRPNRLALRALLHAIELSPFALGHGARLRTLESSARAQWLERLEGLRSPQLRQLVKLFRGIAFLAYYGDDGVMLRLGYDAEAVVRRGRELRLVEGRP